MQLVDKNDPVLIKSCENFDFNNPPFDPVEFSQKLIKCMYDNGGIGLAANQVGVPYRVFGMRGNPENFVCFNPRIVDQSTEQIVLEEGCLTFPGLLVKIKRPKIIKVRFQSPHGEVFTKKFIGMTARIFQHELDHLDGILFFNKANRFHREQAFRKAKL